jgi:SPP1 gp7 family putative phage head morphogenesis protein
MNHEYISVSLRMKLESNRLKRGGKTVIKGPAPSRKIESAYRKSMFLMTKGMKADYKIYLLPIIEEINRQTSQDAAVEDGWFRSNVTALLVQLATAVTELTDKWKGERPAYVDSVRVPSPAQIANDLVNAISVNNARVESAQGVPVERIQESLLHAKVSENVKLIKSIPDRFFPQIETLVLRDQAGEVEDLQLEIKKLFEQSDYNAYRIARDQTSKITAALHAQRMLALGATHYVWITCEDERVRPTHAARHGKTFDYNNPAGGINPGQEIMCRCKADFLINGLNTTKIV